VIGSIGFTFWQVSRSIDAGAPPPSKPAKVAKGDDDDGSKTEAKAPPKEEDPGVEYDFATLDGCSCRVTIDGRRGYAQLSAHFKGPSNDALTTKFTLTTLDDHAQVLPLTKETAPPAKWKGGTMGILMACDGDVVAMAAGNHASGWSAKSGKVVWTKTLDAPFIHPAKTKKGSFTIDCAAGEGDVIAISTEKGDVKLTVKDGKKAQ
jgi:hypothetical protein